MNSIPNFWPQGLKIATWGSCLGGRLQGLSQQAGKSGGNSTIAFSLWNATVSFIFLNRSSKELLLGSLLHNLAPTGHATELLVGEFVVAKDVAWLRHKCSCCYLLDCNKYTPTSSIIIMGYDELHVEQGYRTLLRLFRKRDKVFDDIKRPHINIDYHHKTL